MAIDPGSAVAIFTFAKDTVKGLFSEKVDDRVKEKLQDILDCIDKLQLSALEKNEMLFKYQSDISALKESLRQVQDWNAQLDKYELVTTPGGAVVYQYKSAPEHYACPACINKKEIQILQDYKVISGVSVCPGCNKTFPVNVRMEVQQQQKSGAGWVRGRIA